MSIIYDALKKVEGSNLKSAGEDKKPTRKFKPIYLLYALAVLSGFLIAKLLFDFFLNPPAKVTPVVKPVPAKVKPRPPQRKPIPLEPAVEEIFIFPELSLNGILYDGDQSFAIINNRVVKEGDTVEGVKIMRILENKVDLEFKGRQSSIKPGN